MKSEEVLEEYSQGNYEDLFELLDPDEQKQVAEIAEAQAVLNGETGSLAGMDYLHTGRASD